MYASSSFFTISLFIDSLLHLSSTYVPKILKSPWISLPSHTTCNFKVWNIQEHNSNFQNKSKVFLHETSLTLSWRLYVSPFRNEHWNFHETLLWAYKKDTRINVWSFWKTCQVRLLKASWNLPYLLHLPFTYVPKKMKSPWILILPSLFERHCHLKWKNS